MWKRFLALVGVVTAIYAAMAYAIDINGQLKRAQLEQLASDPTGTLARIYYNTTTNQGRVYNGSVWNVFGNAAGQIPGTATSDSAATGNVGQFTQSRTTALTNAPAATGNFGNMNSISLEAGDWDVTGVADLSRNGATVTRSIGAISVNSGNTTTDHQAGDNQLDGTVPTAALDGVIAIPAYRVSLAATTTIYFKLYMDYSVATPQYRSRVSARRVR